MQVLIQSVIWVFVLFSVFPRQKVIMKARISERNCIPVINLTDHMRVVTREMNMLSVSEWFV